MRKKLFTIVISFVLMACLLPSALAASDISGHWAQSYITYLDEEGVINPSNSTGKYGPDDKVSRAEFMRYVNRAFHFTEKANINYDDVQEDDWFYETIRIATRYGYISGIDDSRMNPKGLINREQAFTILGRLLKENPGGISPSSLPFTDKNNISDWSAGYIKSACDKGIATGYNDGSFQPKKVITRGEVAKILYGVMGTSFSKAGRSYTGSDLKSDTQNATISESCMLSDAVIKGDLYITEGLDADAVTLSNVTVNGNLVISGGTVLLSNSNIKHMIVSTPMGRQLSVTTSNGCNVTQTDVGSATVLYEKGSQEPGLEGFTNVSTTGNGRVSLTLDGAINELKLVNDATVSLAKNSSIHVLTIEKPASITGYGTVYQADIRVNGATFANSVSVAGYTLADNVTATAGGQQVSSSNTPGAYPSNISVQLNNLAEISSGVNISLPAGSSVDSVICDDTSLALSAAYTKTSTGINISAAYLGMLAAGEHTMIITLTDNTQQIVTITVN